MQAMSAAAVRKKMVKGPSRLKIVIPRGFPACWGARTADIGARTWFRRRIYGPLGSFVLHGAMMGILIHVNPLRDFFGQRVADELEWEWLPEVTMVVEPPPPPPELAKVEVSPPPPPPPLPEPKGEPEEPPPSVLAESIPPPPLEDLAPPALEPVAEPQAAVAVPAVAAEPEVWTEVRAGIMKSLRYPAQARRNGIEGVVYVTIRLDEAGHIASVKINPPAPAAPLCAAVLAAVRRAGPFPAVGEAIHQGQSPETAEIVIRFKLDGSNP
jgi:TonB family protein